MRQIILFIFLFFLHFGLYSQNSAVIWNGNITTVDNFNLNMKNYIGKKIIIATFDASRPDTTFLLSLDSLNLRLWNNVSIIAVPVSDFGAPISSISLISLIRFLHLSYPVTQISKGKRGSGQLGLLQWVTTTSSSNHFNSDLLNSCNIYIVSTHSVLYAMLPSTTNFSGGLLNDCLAKDPSE